MIQAFKYTEVLEVNLFAFAYRLFHEDFFVPDVVQRIQIYYNQSILVKGLTYLEILQCLRCYAVRIPHC